MMQQTKQKSKPPHHLPCPKPSIRPKLSTLLTTITKLIHEQGKGKGVNGSSYQAPQMHFPLLRLPINQNHKTDRRWTPFNPAPPFYPITFPIKSVIKKVTVNMIVGFLRALLELHPSFGNFLVLKNYVSIHGHI